MNFEGLPSARELLGSDAINPYQAAFSARMEFTGKPLVKDRKGDGSIRMLGREAQANPEDEAWEDGADEHEGKAFSDEEAEQIRLFARMRGVMNFALESGVRYGFRINAASGCVDLVNMETGSIVLQLRPEEMIRLSERIQRYAGTSAGMLTDCSG